MHDLPKRLQEDVSMKRCGSLLKKMPLFAFTGDPAFVRQISVVTSFYFFAPGDIVIYGGDLGREMYVIREGYVEVRCRHFIVVNISPVLRQYRFYLKT